MPKAFSESERSRIRERLLEAGKRAINQRGVRAVVIDEIAWEANVSKGSFYAFFPSREEFILSVFESWEAHYRTPLFEQVVSGQGTPRERLERFFLGALSVFEKEPGLARLSLGEILAIMERLPPARMAAHVAADEKAWRGAVAAWVRAGVLDRKDAPALRGLLTALNLVAIHRGDFPEGTYDTGVRLLSEALAQRLSGEGVIHAR